MLKLLPVILLVLLTAGCAAAGPQPSKSYDTIKELQQDFAAAGGDCGLMTEDGPDDRGRFAMASGDCNGGESTMTLFASSDERDAFLKFSAALGLERHLLVGENWVISPADEDPGKYVSKLGGEVVDQ